MRNALIVAIALALLPFGALAQSEEKLVERYTSLAGSEANARALVAGLRSGSDIELVFGASTIVIDPPTGKMGNGNVNIALALTKASLQDVTHPTPQQFEAALTDVLQRRADGAGWGEIAKSLGFKVGEVVRSERAQPELRSAHVESRRADRAERVARVERPDRPARPEKPEKPERPHR